MFYEGSPTLISNPFLPVQRVSQLTASVALARSYQPYGTVLSSTGAGTTSYAFTGEWQDGTSLIHLRARYYSVGQGRFITRDPWRGDYRRPLTLNGWNYTEGNPVNRVDPSGHFSQGVNGDSCVIWVYIPGPNGLLQKWCLLRRSGDPPDNPPELPTQGYCGRKERQRQRQKQEQEENPATCFAASLGRFMDDDVHLVSKIECRTPRADGGRVVFIYVLGEYRGGSVFRQHDEPCPIPENRSARCVAGSIVTGEDAIAREWVLVVRAQDIAKSFSSKKAQDIANSFSTVP